VRQGIFFACGGVFGLLRPNALDRLIVVLEPEGFHAEEKNNMETTDSKNTMDSTRLITVQIAGLTDWRITLMIRLRALIQAVDPELTEEWQWDSAVWSKKGNVVSICAFNDHVSLNFFKGASLDDPQGLFNAGLEAKAMRSIDFFENDDIQESALKQLIRAAAAYNLAGGKRN
jgi:hypothetical protein